MMGPFGVPTKLALVVHRKKVLIETMVKLLILELVILIGLVAASGGFV